MLKLSILEHKILLRILGFAEQIADTDNFKIGIKRTRETLKGETFRNGVVVKINDKKKIQQCIVVLNRILNEETEKIELISSMDVLNMDEVLSRVLIKLYELA